MKLAVEDIALSKAMFKSIQFPRQLKSSAETAYVLFQDSL